MGKTLVSVVMITYGHQEYILEAINGVLKQEFDGIIELIIANDNSPDETDAICQEYFSTLELGENFLIRYTKHEKNKGVIPNFVWALKQAKGEFIAICEGDDYWIDPLKLQKQVDFLEAHEDHGLVYTDIDIYVQDTGILTKNIFTKQYKPFTAYEDLIYFRYIAPCSWLMQSKVLFAILEEEIMDSLDGTYVLMLMFAIKSKIHFIADSTAVYRELPESASNTKSTYKKYVRSVDLWKTQARFINQMKPLQIHQEVNSTFVNNNLLWMLVFQDWETFRLIRKLDLKLSNKFRLVLQVGRTRALFNVVSRFARSFTKMPV